MYKLVKSGSKTEEGRRNYPVKIKLLYRISVSGEKRRSGAPYMHDQSSSRKAREKEKEARWKEWMADLEERM